MWEKWVFLATLATATCLMRAAIGDIVKAPGGMEVVLRPPRMRAARWRRPTAMRRATASSRAPATIVTAADSTAHRIDAARHRARGADRGRPHRRRPDPSRRRKRRAGDLKLLRIAYAHLYAYEVRRQRVAAEAAQTAPGAP